MWGSEEDAREDIAVRAELEELVCLWLCVGLVVALDDAAIEMLDFDMNVAVRSEVDYHIRLRFPFIQSDICQSIIQGVDQ